MSELLVFKSLAQLDDPIRPEVKDDDRVPVLDRADRGTRLVNDNERIQPLIADRLIGIVLPQRLDSRVGVLERVRGNAEDVCVPAPLNNVPIGLIAIHCDGHPATPGRNLRVTRRRDLLEDRLKLVDEFQARAVRDVPPVCQDMYAEFLGTTLNSPSNNAEQLIRPAVHATIGQEPDEVKGAAIVQVAGHVVPPVAREQASIGQRLVNERSTLIDDLSRAEGVVPNLGVAHVIVRRQPDGRAVRANRSGPVFDRHERVHARRLGRKDGIVLVLGHVFA